jgi:plastocyanin
MTMRIGNSRLGWATATAVLSLALINGAGTAAQDASPAASPAADAGHPGHIHSGTCDALGDVVVPLPNVVFGATDAAMASPAAGGAAAANPAVAVSSVVDLALSDLLAEEHAINYHASAEEIGTYIACGAISGAPDDQGNLFIGLAEQNDSGISGIAWLLEQGGQTVVTVFLTEEPGAAAVAAPAETAVAEETPAAMETPAAATPADMASPASAGTGAAAETEFTVTSADISFEPAELTVPADTEVTINLPNEGALPHNFSIDDLSISVDIPAGGEETTTLTAPAGQHEYYCNVTGHKEAGMVGTLTAE